MKVKICGITNPEDALAAVQYGADVLGFVFYPESPRYVTAQLAREIVEELPPFITTVGVFVNETATQIRETMLAARLHVVQLHGDETPDVWGLWTPAIKTFRVRDFSDLNAIKEFTCVSAYLLDTYTADEYGGTGQIFNWDIAVEAKKFGRVILSGGLSPDNVMKAIRWVKPYAVDVSSGVEAKKGKKDHRKMKEFIELAKKALP